MIASASAFSNATTFRRASARPRSRSPACVWSAPQHVCSPTTITSTPFRASTRAVAAFVDPNALPMTQPLNIATRARRSPMAATTPCGPSALVWSGTRSRSSASREAERSLIARSTVATCRRFARLESIAKPASVLRCGMSQSNATARTNRSTADRGRAIRICERAASTSLPYSTPEGHAVSHARQSTHCEMCFSNPAESAPTRPSHTVFISRMRPRGESVSTPSTA